MIQAGLLDDKAIDEVLNFYLTNARDEILYPKDSNWVFDHLGADFFMAGIKINGNLTAAAWMAKLKDFVYFAVENESLLIKNDGVYAYSGGWCIQSDFRSRGLFQLLTATVNTIWFHRINIDNKSSVLWGRMVGQKDLDGNPLFWNKIGKLVTGLSYQDLLTLPFGTMEKTIFERWPKEPMPIKDLPKDILLQTLGKTSKPLIKPLNQFLKWGWVTLSDRFVPTSLNCFFWAVKENIADSQGFYDEALSKVMKEF